jgi:hypothetical protein
LGHDEFARVEHDFINLLVSCQVVQVYGGEKRGQDEYRNARISVRARRRRDAMYLVFMVSTDSTSRSIYLDPYHSFPISALAQWSKDRI